MRLIATLDDLQKALILSSYLDSRGIGGEVEVSARGDKESATPESTSYKVWIYDENGLEQAIAIAQEYLANPTGKEFRNYADAALPESLFSAPEKEARRSSSPSFFLTPYIIALCTFLFLWGALFLLSSGEGNRLKGIPLFYAPVTKALLFDYPHAYEILDRLTGSFGIEALTGSAPLPPQAAVLLEDYASMSVWQGIYRYAVHYVQHPGYALDPDVPLFEKIRQGQIWRFFTPTFLHGDIFHLLFNMIWLSVLGKQLESKMGMVRSLLFIAVAASVSNTAQYLMSGSNFLGFSGVLCAMLSFIWLRQHRAPWEGYFLQSSTIGFMFAFLGVMFFLQVISFYTETAYDVSIAPPVANTAHLSGLLSGLFMGRLPLFRWSAGR